MFRLIPHILALGVLALDVMVRAWRIQLAAWTAGGRLSTWEAIRLNMYGEAASTLTPNRLGGEPARFAGMTECNMRPVTALVALGVEVAAEWPVFLLLGLVLAVNYVPDWKSRGQVWLRHHIAADLVLVELVVLVVLVVVWWLQRSARSGAIRHRVRRQWRVALAHVRRAPVWVMLANAALTVASLAARGLVLPALAWGLADAPPFTEMFYGSLAMLAAPLAVPLPSGGGGIEVVFLSGFAGDFGDAQVQMLLLWRFYTMLLLTGIGIFLMIRYLGLRAAKELFSVGWRRKRKAPDAAAVESS
ncbi:MAG TPA: lysylphosphatidylglycerol synthase transmembrane domain-containing protein [Gemmatimonadales bacterium]|nr:lysylphosphatidylglycerol synthase transmembrane domain-containing protein [Gemmatimonadales bacterium]